MPSDAARRRTLLLDGTLFALSVLGLAWLAAHGAQAMGYRWQWHRVPVLLWAGGAPGPLLEGLAMTLRLSLFAGLGALAAGLAAALLALSPSLAGRWLARGYVEAVRNTPLFIQLLFLYFVLAPALDMDAMAAAVLGLSLFEGAYVAEILRGGLASIDTGQWDAAKSLGMNAASALRLVALPQALRRVLPPLAGQSVSLVKDSSLASVIAIAELTLRGGEAVARTFMSFEIWFTVALLYWLVTTALSALASGLERRLGYPV